MAKGKTIESRENELISLAVNQAEQMLREGRAPQSVLLHYLQLGASDYSLRKERLERQNELMRAKKDALEKQDYFEELAKNAIEAMQRYSGRHSDEDSYEEEII